MEDEAEDGEVLEASEWFEDTLLSSFWKNYNLADEWLRSRGVQPIVADLSGSQNPSEDNLVFPRNKAGEHEAKTLYVKEIENVNEEEDSEVEVSSEYLEFIALTRKHQKDRENLRTFKKSKNKRTKNAEPTYQNITSVDSVFERSHIPTDVSDPKNLETLRKLQSEQWYGSESNVIDKMETGIQADYDHFVESKSPCLWPETPLRMDIYFKN